MTIAVYCSAKDIIPEEYLALGDEVGKWIAEHGHRLVYGGATGGLMTRTSDAVKRAGGYVIGVIPERIKHARRESPNCDEIHHVQVMSERKQMMRELADCFICLPGSYGTLDEMFDVIASGTVGEHRKPCFILNYKGFYQGLKDEVEHMRSLLFLPREEQYKPQFVDTIEELFTCINQYNHD